MIGGRAYPLCTDFRVGAAVQLALSEGEPVTAEELLRWFFGDPRLDPAVRWPRDVDAALEGIGRFLRRKDAPSEEPQETEPGRRPEAWDLLVDADILLADFQRVYGIDLTTAELHWWRFLALLEGLYAWSFADRVRFRVTDPAGLPPKQRRELLKQRQHFAIRRNRDGTSCAGHIAYLDSIIEKHQKNTEEGSEAS